MSSRSGECRGAGRAPRHPSDAAGAPNSSFSAPAASGAAPDPVDQIWIWATSSARACSKSSRLIRPASYSACSAASASSTSLCGGADPVAGVVASSVSFSRPPKRRARLAAARSWRASSPIPLGEPAGAHRAPILLSATIRTPSACTGRSRRVGRDACRRAVERGCRNSSSARWRPSASSAELMIRSTEGIRSGRSVTIVWAICSVSPSSAAEPFDFQFGAAGGGRFLLGAFLATGFGAAGVSAAGVRPRAGWCWWSSWQRSCRRCCMAVVRGRPSTGRLPTAASTRSEDAAPEIRDEAELRQPGDQPLARVVLPPPDAVAVVERESVVEVVVALAEGDERGQMLSRADERASKRRVPTRWANEFTQNVACRSTALRRKPTTSRPPIGSPQSVAIGRRQHQADADGEDGIPVMLKTDAAHRPQIGEAADVGRGLAPAEQPTDVGEPDATGDGVGIAVAVGVGVMRSVVSAPRQRRVLERRRSDRRTTTAPAPRRVGAMSEQR